VIIGAPCADVPIHATGWHPSEAAAQRCQRYVAKVHNIRSTSQQPIVLGAAPALCSFNGMVECSECDPLQENLICECRRHRAAQVGHPPEARDGRDVQRCVGRHDIGKPGFRFDGTPAGTLNNQSEKQVAAQQDGTHVALEAGVYSWVQEAARQSRDEHGDAWRRCGLQGRGALHPSSNSESTRSRGDVCDALIEAALPRWHCLFHPQLLATPTTLSRLSSSPPTSSTGPTRDCSADTLASCAPPCLLRYGWRCISLTESTWRSTQSRRRQSRAVSGRGVIEHFAVRCQIYLRPLDAIQAWLQSATFTSSATIGSPLWNQSVGAHFPRMRYWWRVEPDVAFSGSWGSLLLRLAQPQGDEADVLLPRVISYRTDPNFPHYFKNLDVLEGLPRSEWCKSLVAIARYSMRFMAHMTALWLRGTLGYEELFLPTQCVLLGHHGACRLKSLHNVTRRSSLRAFPASDTEAPPIGRPEVFRYRPEVQCDDVARATTRDTRELWHPLKRRECLLDVGSPPPRSQVCPEKISSW